VLEPFGASASTEPVAVIHGGRVPPEDPSTVADTAVQRAERGLEEASALAPLCHDLGSTGRIAGCENPAAFMPPPSVQKKRFEALAAALGAAPRAPAASASRPALSNEAWTTIASDFAIEARAAGLRPEFFNPFLEAARRWDDFESVRIPIDPAAFGGLGVPVTRIQVLEQDDVPGIAAEIRRVLGTEARIASVALVSADLSRVLEEDFTRAAWLVALAIILLIAAAFRRPGQALLTLVPVAVGVVWMLGALRLTEVELNLMTLMAMPIVLGLGVDYGVYFVDRWAKGGRDAAEALRSTGPAILVTGLTTLAGFGALLGADLAGLQTLGLAVVLGAGFTLAAALLLLPLLVPGPPRSR